MAPSFRHFDGRVIIREQEDERTYINYLRVKAVASDGSYWFLPLQHGPNKRPSGYMEIGKGEEAEFLFRLPKQPDLHYYLVADGFYTLSEADLIH